MLDPRALVIKNEQTKFSNATTVVQNAIAGTNDSWGSYANAAATNTALITLGEVEISGGKASNRLGNDGFPNKLYSIDANMGGVYVSNQNVINVFGQSCQPVAGIVTVWGIAMYETLAGSSSVIPNGAAAPVLMLQIMLQIEDWRRTSILMEYNNEGGGQGMIMRYSESIQDWNGYLHIERSTTLIDASTGRVYGTFGQNYLPRK